MTEMDAVKTADCEHQIRIGAMACRYILYHVHLAIPCLWRAVAVSGIARDKNPLWVYEGFQPEGFNLA